jgi:Tfp pilus assembly protein PilZ
MAPLVDQVEKQTILARLSVSIYKMTDGQLAALLAILEEEGTVAVRDFPSLPPDADANMRRHMMIARTFVLINQMDKDMLLNKLQPINHPDFQWAREFPRLSCYLMVDFAAGGKAYQSCIRDISANGVFIETTSQFEEGQRISLCFTLVESDETLPFKVKGRVTRIYPDGIGVQYENMTHYQRDIINALLDKIK